MPTYNFNKSDKFIPLLFNWKSIKPYFKENKQEKKDNRARTNLKISNRLIIGFFYFKKRKKWKTFIINPYDLNRDLISLSERNFKNINIILKN